MLDRSFPEAAAPPRPRRRARWVAARPTLVRRLAARRVMALVLAAAIAVAVDRYRFDDGGRPPEVGAPPPQVEVAVATRDLTAGDQITGDMIRFVTVDPDDGLAGAGLRPEGQRLQEAVGSGEIIADGALGVLDSRGLRIGERAVAIAGSLSPLALEAGDTVELVSVAAAGDGGARSEILGSAGRVLSVDDRTVVVAVPAGLAAEVVRRQAVGAVELIRVP